MDNLTITIHYKGQPHPTPLVTPATTILSDFRTQVTAHLSLPSQTLLRMLVCGKDLAHSNDALPLSETPLLKTHTLYVYGTAASVVAEVRSQKPDQLVAPFTRPSPRYTSAPRRTQPPPGAIGSSEKYGFERIEALPEYADRARAEEILETLRSDPGFLSVMRQKRWTVGALKEMPPEGSVGVDPVCVLGYNTNKGAEIHLRLRTDDEEGFRGMSTIRQVLAHELAHNEVSEHNNSFKELMRWIEREAEKKNWRTGGRTLVNGWQTAQTVGVDPLDEGTRAADGRLSIVRKLGEAREGDVVREIGQDVKMTEAGNARVADYPKPAPSEEAKQKPAAPPAEPQCEPELTDLKHVPEASVEDTQMEAASSSVAAGVEMKPVPRRKTKVAELTAMGYNSVLAGLALRENARDINRAVNWLVSLTPGEHASASAESVGENQKATMERVQGAMSRLQAAELSREDFVSVLDRLHFYLSNLLRNLGKKQFSTINASNPGFRSRVGNHAAATELLILAGFRLSEGFWTYSSEDVGPLWLTKSVVQDTLVQNLRPQSS